MKIKLIETIMTFLVLVITIFETSLLFGQNKQKVPEDFFTGKWGGVISGEVVDEQRRYPFRVELIGQPSRRIGYVFGGVAAHMRIDATWPGKFTRVDSVVCLLTFANNKPFFFLLILPVTLPPSKR